MNYKKIYKKRKVMWVMGTGILLSGLIVSFILSGLSFDGSNNFSLILEGLQAAQSPLNETSFEANFAPQKGVAASVVNIVCDGGVAGTGGSGIVINSSGKILTNYHLIPKRRSGEPSVDSCIITIPDVRTGKIREMYVAKPNIVPELSAQYDLAFFDITGPYIDADGKTYGSMSNTFTTLGSCTNNDPVIGESIRVYGYPTIGGGGFYLTVTNGIVSALPNDGTIITSAKISSGSSGGLAVDEKGCVVGMPSMVDVGKDESLGVVTSVHVLDEFLIQTRVSKN